MFLLAILLALGSVAAAPVTGTTTTTASTVPSGWAIASTPCIAEGTSGRALSAVSFSSSAMTVETCLAYCKNAGYPIAGIEFSSECYCGAFLSNGASLNNAASCYMTCSGNSNQLCGSPGALSLYVQPRSYSLSQLSSDYTTPTTLLPAGWSSTGCFKEPSTGRALDNAVYTSSSMTVSMCLNYCAGKGFAYAGVEFGKECYCDDSLRNAVTTATTCNVPCAGAPQQICGGSGTISVYTNPSYLTTTTQSNGYASQGCIQEVSGRAFVGASTSSNSMTVDTCTSFCKTKGFKYAAVEYGKECYCGADFANGASTSKYSTQCNMGCSGNAAQTCGGPNAISLYVSS